MFERILNTPLSIYLIKLTSEQIFKEIWQNFDFGNIFGQILIFIFDQKLIQTFKGKCNLFYLLLYLVINSGYLSLLLVTSDYSSLLLIPCSSKNDTLKKLILNVLNFKIFLPRLRSKMELFEKRVHWKLFSFTAEKYFRLTILEKKLHLRCLTRF